MSEHSHFNASEELLTPTSKNHLLTSAKWAKLIGILGFIFSLFIVFIGIALMTSGNSLLNMANGNAENRSPISGMAGTLGGLLYLVIACVYFIISWWMFKFGTEMKTGLLSSSSSEIESSFNNLKNYFMAFGILTLISLGIMIFVLLAAVVMGLAVSNAGKI